VIELEQCKIYFPNTLHDCNPESPSQNYGHEKTHDVCFGCSWSNTFSCKNLHATHYIHQ